MLKFIRNSVGLIVFCLSQVFAQNLVAIDDELTDNKNAIKYTFNQEITMPNVLFIKENSMLIVDFKAFNPLDLLTYKSHNPFVESIINSEKNEALRSMIFLKNDSDYELLLNDNVLIINFFNKDDLNTDSIKNEPLIKDMNSNLISLNFQDIDIRKVLSAIAEFSDFNLVVSDSVKGQVTLHLKNVSHTDALDVILKTKGLFKQKIGDIVYIMPLSEETKTAPELFTEIIQLNNVKATDLVTVLSSSIKNKQDENDIATGLSDFGSINVDPVQNVLIVKDTQKQLALIHQLVKRLDKPSKQVTINAQIAITSSSFVRNIGVQWGVNAQNNASTDDTQIWGGGSFDYGINNAQSIIGLSILKRTFNIGAELQLMQTNGDAEVLSSPSLTTTDQKEAYIQQGSQIAYTTTTENNGNNTQFKDVLMELRVTPQITPDNRVVMDLLIKKDEVDGFLPNGEPSIVKREIKTEAVVVDGETVVIGGVYEVRSREQMSKVPFFGDIPLLGNLFKSKGRSQNQLEMVIFLTPHILN